MLKIYLNSLLINKTMQNRINVVIILLISNFFYGNTKNDPNVKKVYTTVKIDKANAPTIDGLLNEPIWDTVVWGGDFTEFEPDNNTDPSQETRFKILYDDDNLYIVVRAYDSEPEKIISRLSRRDNLNSDGVFIAIDSYHDLRTAFMFGIGAGGDKSDWIASDNGEDEDSSWNPIWDVKTTIDDLGWNAEIKIPINQLRFKDGSNIIWGFNIMRGIHRLDEKSLWDHVPVDSPGWISEIGELHGLNLKSKNQVDIRPFVTASMNTYESVANNPYRDGKDTNFNGGLDAKIGITNDLILDLTFNPDFGQVEADPSVITLDGYEIFMQEKRPFFVESKNIFDYSFGPRNDNLFFSRRIGKAPSGSPSLNSGEYYESPQFTKILGAAKFSGKTENGWSIGVLESITANEYANINDGENVRREKVEPLTNYLVTRIQKDFNDNNTFVGGIITSTNRSELPDNLNFLHKSAMTAGIDFKHQWNNKNYYFEGKFIGSNVKGSEESIYRTQTSITHLFQRVDASHLEVDPTKTSLKGTGGVFMIGKQGGGHWTYDLGFDWHSPELELNDLGFLKQADHKAQFAAVAYRSLNPKGKIRSFEMSLRQFSTYDFEGNHNRTQYAFGSEIRFMNNYAINIGGAHKPRIYINSFLRGGPRWKFNQENYMYTFVMSDQSKKLRGFIGAIYSQAKQNNFSMFKMEAGLTYTPSDKLLFSISPEYVHNPNKTQYVTTVNYDGSYKYILASLDSHTLMTNIRVNYTVNPKLTIQYYGQPFIFRAKYNQFKYVTNPTADNLNNRFNLYNEDQINIENNYYSIDHNLDETSDYGFYNPNFSTVQFRSNLVLRWEYRRGSELYFVWSQGLNTFIDTSESLVDGISLGLKEKPENTFLIKATFSLGN